MPLYERICGRDDNGVANPDLNKIAIAQLAALLSENTYASITRQNIIDIIGISIAEEVDLDIMSSKGGNTAQQREFVVRISDIFMLAELNTPGYGTPTELKTIVEAL